MRLVKYICVLSFLNSIRVGYSYPENHHLDRYQIIKSKIRNLRAMVYRYYESNNLSYHGTLKDSLISRMNSFILDLKQTTLDGISKEELEKFTNDFNSLTKKLRIIFNVPDPHEVLDAKVPLNEQELFDIKSRIIKLNYKLELLKEPGTSMNEKQNIQDNLRRLIFEWKLIRKRCKQIDRGRDCGWKQLDELRQINHDLETIWHKHDFNYLPSKTLNRIQNFHRIQNQMDLEHLKFGRIPGLERLKGAISLLGFVIRNFPIHLEHGLGITMKSNLINATHQLKVYFHAMEAKYNEGLSQGIQNHNLHMTSPSSFLEFSRASHDAVKTIEQVSNYINQQYASGDTQIQRIATILTYAYNRLIRCDHTDVAHITPSSLPNSSYGDTTHLSGELGKQLTDHHNTGFDSSKVSTLKGEIADLKDKLVHLNASNSIPLINEVGAINELKNARGALREAIDEKSLRSGEAVKPDITEAESVLKNVINLSDGIIIPAKGKGHEKFSKNTNSWNPIETAAPISESHLKNELFDKENQLESLYPNRLSKIDSVLLPMLGRAKENLGREEVLEDSPTIKNLETQAKEAVQRAIDKLNLLPRNTHKMTPIIHPVEQARRLQTNVIKPKDVKLFIVKPHPVVHVSVIPGVPIVKTRDHHCSQEKCDSLQRDEHSMNLYELQRLKGEYKRLKDEIWGKSHGDTSYSKREAGLTKKVQKLIDALEVAIPSLDPSKRDQVKVSQAELIKVARDLEKSNVSIQPENGLTQDANFHAIHQRLHGIISDIKMLKEKICKSPCRLVGSDQNLREKIKRLLELVKEGYGAKPTILPIVQKLRALLVHVPVAIV